MAQIDFSKYGLDKATAPVGQSGRIDFAKYGLGTQGANNTPNEPQPFAVPTTPQDKQANYQNAVASAEKAKQEANTSGGFLNIAANTVGNIGKTLASSEIGLGQTIAKTFGNQSESYANTISSLNNTQAQLLQLIKKHEKEGKDTLELKKAYNQNIQQLKDAGANLNEEANLPTTGQAVGQLGGTALDTLTAGTYKTAKSGINQVASGLFTKPGLTNVAKGAGIGYGYDVAQGLQGQRGEDRTGGSAFIPGLGTAIGGGITALSEGMQSYKNIKQPTSDQVNKAVNDLESKYSEWSGGTKSGKNTLNKINQKTVNLNKAGTEGVTPMRKLAEDGVVPQTSGTKFNTYDQAVEYRQKTAPLQEANKQALAEVGLSTQPIELSTLREDAIKFARSSDNINSGKATGMVADINKEFDNLLAEYPTGKIPLGLADDIKSARWNNVFKNKSLIEADVLKKDSEYSIAKAIQKRIETVADEAGHTEVAQLNREIGSILDASKFLESFDGKTLKGGRMAKYVGTIIGSSLGQTLPGKIVGAIGGNAVANLLIKSSVQSPIRRIILSRLQKSNPEAYTATLKWITEQDAARNNRLALPAPLTPAEKIKATGVNTLNNDGSVITPPTPTTYETPANTSFNQDRLRTLPLLGSGDGKRLPVNPDAIKIAPRGSNIEITSKEGVTYQSKSPNAKQTNAATSNVTNIPNNIPQNTKKTIPNKQGGFIKTGVSQADSVSSIPENKLKGTQVEYLGNNYTVIKQSGVGGDKIIIESNGKQLQIPKSQAKIADINKEPVLDTLNPTGSLYVDYTPESRAKIKLADNITTLDKTMGRPADEMITIYRGAPKIQKSIVPGDFVTTNYELAKSYTGENNVLSKKVKLSDVLDDLESPLGEEYLFRPSTNLTDDLVREAKKYKSAEDFVNKQPIIYHGTPNKFRKFDNSKSYTNSTWFSDSKDAVSGNKVEMSLPPGQRINVMERYIKPDIKLLDTNTPEGQKLHDNMMTIQLKEMGYKGVKYQPDAERGTYIELFNPNEDTVTKSQLEEIWNKANKGSTNKGSILKNPLMVGAGILGGASIGAKMLSDKKKANLPKKK